MSFSDALHLLDVGASRQETLAERFRHLHRQVAAAVPAVDHMSCGLYDAALDRLQNCVGSALSGLAATGGELQMARNAAWFALAEAPAGHRGAAIDDLRAAGAFASCSRTDWLLAQGYRASYGVPLSHQGRFIGFLYFDSCSAGAFGPAVQAQLGIYVDVAGLLVSQALASIESLVGALSVARGFARLRDVETGGHLERMSRYARLIARELGPGQGLDDEFVQQIFLFAPLHDIGKIGVPDRVLQKPGPLDAAERALMQTHVAKGVQMVERLVEDFDLREQPGIGVLRNMVAGHHELLDGSGYPLGLRGMQIPIEARITAVADIYDALTSRRSYKRAWTDAEAVVELRQMVGAGKLDRDCVEALLACPGECADIRARYPAP